MAANSLLNVDVKDSEYSNILNVRNLSIALIGPNDFAPRSSGDRSC
jgi:hypothetical protein